MPVFFPPSPAADPMVTGLGLKKANYNPAVMASGIASATQVLYTIVIPTTIGEIYTGVKLWVNVAGTSTAPTGFFVGLATQGVIGATGTMLAQSDNLKDSASLTTAGFQSFAFNASYTETATGFRVVTMLQNGAFAGTNVNFGRLGIATMTAGSALYMAAGTGQTALPANTASLPAVFTGSGALGFWVSLY